MAKKQTKKSKDKGGRPTKMDKATVDKLETVFSMDGTVEEACYYAGISRQTYYKWLKENPEYTDRFEGLRNKPVLKARQAVVNSLDDPDRAFRYLERKRKDEFSSRSELTGKDGKELMPSRKQEITEALKDIL